MTSPHTNNILRSVEERLHACVISGHQYDLAGIKRVIAVCRLHYKTWEESVKLEANNTPYAYSNLPQETKDMDIKVKWYFKLLTALVNEES